MGTLTETQPLALNGKKLSVVEEAGVAQLHSGPSARKSSTSDWEQVATVNPSPMLAVVQEKEALEATREIREARASQPEFVAELGRHVQNELNELPTVESEVSSRPPSFTEVRTPTSPVAEDFATSKALENGFSTVNDLLLFPVTLYALTSQYLKKRKS